jgi:hypothetical protein
MSNLVFLLSLQNPFSKRFDNIFSIDRKISKYKAIEVEVLKTPVVFCITTELSMRKDHAGLFLNLGLFGYEVVVSIYDTRHWNYENDKPEE